MDGAIGDVNIKRGAEHQRWLPWLADAPLFIDGPQVADFHDAILRPRYRTTQVQLDREWVTQVTTSFGGDLGASLPVWFPWLKVEGSLSGEREEGRSEHEAQNVTLEPIENPARQLVELALHYVANHDQRIWVQTDATWNIPTPEEIKLAPRMLACIEFPPGTRFIPMAAELSDGQVVTFFDQLVDRFKREEGTLPPRYVEDLDAEDAEENLRRAETRKRYWGWFEEYWSAQKAMQVIEDRIGRGGRPRWIDYRVPVGSDTPIHLHVVGSGTFDTGVFAYNLVKRGFKYGLRMLGRVKTAPDINVLAIYES